MSSRPVIALALAGTLACSQKKDAPEQPPAPSPSQPAPAAPPEPAPPTGPTPVPLPPGPQVLGEAQGFASPTSVVYLADQDVFLVANLGAAGAADDGFVSKLGPDGQVQQLRWIDGASANVELREPRGMLVRNGLLFVADGTKVRMFDLPGGQPEGEMDISGATTLVDVAGDADALYVTDSGRDGKRPGAGAVWRIDNRDQQTLLARGTALAEPGAATVAPDGALWVASLASAEVYRLVDGKKTAETPLPGAGLTGLQVLPDGRFIVASQEARGVYIGTPGGAFTLFAESVATPGDLAVDSKRGRVAVPLTEAGTVRFYAIPAAR